MPAVAQRQVPIVLFFNRVGCPYCERALREYLARCSAIPRMRAGRLFRQIEIDKRIPLTDFAGKATTHRELAIALQGHA
jgi:hypothetical protein